MCGEQLHVRPSIRIFLERLKVVRSRPVKAFEIDGVFAADKPDLEEIIGYGPGRHVPLPVRRIVPVRRMNDKIVQLLRGRKQCLQVGDHVPLLQRVLDQRVVFSNLPVEKFILNVSKHKGGPRLVNLHVGITVREREHGRAPQ